MFQIKRLTATAVSAVLAGSAVVASITLQISPATKKVYAATDCIVNPAKTYQTIDGFGGMSLPEWTGGDLTDAQRKKAFGNGTDELGLSMVRIFVSDDKNQWKNAVPTAKYAQSMGAKVFATPWNPPDNMTERFTRTYKDWDGQTKTQANQKRLRHDKYGDYADHLNNFVTFMKQNGVNLSAISIQNEPDYGSEWTWMTSDECIDFLDNYAYKIKCPILSPETFSYNKEYYNKELNDKKAFNAISVFGTHFYGTQRKNMDFPALENCGKPIWMTEVYVPNSSSDADTWPEAVAVAENIHNGLVVGNMSAYNWWYIRRKYSLLKENGNISKRGYCFAQYSKYIRPGDKRIDATESPNTNILVSAFKNNNGQIEVVAVNKGPAEVSQKFTVSNTNIKSVDRYRTTGSENLAKTANLKLTGTDGFWGNLPANSVSTFVIKTGSGSITTSTAPTTKITTTTTTTTTTITKSPKPDENGYYFHDAFDTPENVAVWSSRGDAKIGLSGRMPYKGKNAAIISERQKSWNGAVRDISNIETGKKYSISCDFAYADSKVLSQEMRLTLEYKDSTGEVRYKTIASKTAIKGQWTQLANQSFEIPSDAADMKLVCETTEGTDNFYIDEAFLAVDGTKIDGPKDIKVIKGDLNGDGRINAKDGSLMKIYLANGFSNGLDEYIADINNDNSDTVADAVLIKKFLLGIK